ncbi:MAG: hypothetical protein AB1649_33475, partial [Chloroflexota bacterium]
GSSNYHKGHYPAHDNILLQIKILSSQRTKGFNFRGTTSLRQKMLALSLHRRIRERYYQCFAVTGSPVPVYYPKCWGSSASASGRHSVVGI